MKRWAVYLARAVLCSQLAFVAGCTTVFRPGPDSGAAPETASAAAFAEALARYSTGLALEWQNDPSGSFSNFLRAAELDPDNEELQFRVALSLIQQRRAPEAVALMERLAKRRPKSERVQLWMALTYQASGDQKQALATYERVRKINPRSTVPYLQKAELLLREKKFEEAVETLESGLDRVDDARDLYRALGPLEHNRTRVELGADQKPTHLAKTIRTFEQAVARYPEEDGLREMLGRFYIMNGQIDRALETYAPLEKKNTDDLRQDQQMAMSFLLAPDRKATLETLAAKAEQDPSQARVHFYLGTVLEHSKLPYEAAEAYRRAISAAPQWPAPYLRRVVLQVAGQEPEEAILTLEDGLQQLPDEVRFLELLAYIQLGRQDYPGALDAFARAEQAMQKTKKTPVSASFSLSYAFTQQVSGNYDDAARRLNQAMKKNPALLDAYIQYVFRSDDTNHLAGCIRVLEQMGQSTNASPAVFTYQGLLHNAQEEYPAAIAAFEKAEARARALENEDELLGATFLFWYASACERNGELDRSIQLFERILANPPPARDREGYKAYVDALNYHAYMHAERGQDLDRALTNINLALSVRPDSPAFIDTRGWIYFMQGRYDLARVDIERALQLLPNDPTITDHMGDLEDKAGQPELALTWWKKAYVLDPTNDKVAAKLTALQVDLAPLQAEADALKKAKLKQQAEESSGQLPDFDVEDPPATQMDDAAPAPDADEPLLMPEP